MPSSHDYIKDKRNRNIKIFINNKFYLREKAKVSVFDSGFLLGDGVWSGIRFHNNKFLFLRDHLNRLFEDAKKIALTKDLKDFQTDIINLAIALFEKRASHAVYWKEEEAKNRFDQV